MKSQDGQAPTDYVKLAKQQLKDEAAARAEAEVANRAAQLAWADELVAIHARLCAKHGLNPFTTSKRKLADAVRAYEAAWTSFVGSRCGGSSRAVNILNKETPEFAAINDAWRKQFEATWPPADLSARIGEAVTDGVEAHYGHAVRAA